MRGRLILSIFVLIGLTAAAFADEIMKGQIGLTKDGESFNVQNPDVIQRNRNRFYFGDLCDTQNGGVVTVLQVMKPSLIAEGDVLVSYKWEDPNITYQHVENPRHCADGTILSLKSDKFIQMRTKYEKREIMRKILRNLTQNNAPPTQ